MRLNEIFLLVGRRACGKTTFTKQLLAKSQKKVLVIDTFDHPDYREFPAMQLKQLPHWKSGNYRLYQADPEESLQTAFNHCYNCTIVLEDARRYIEPSVQKFIRQGIIEHRNRNIDLIFQFHNLKDIPPYICSMHNRLVLFKTNDNINVRLDKFSNWDEIAATHRRIMANSSQYHKEVITLQ